MANLNVLPQVNTKPSSPAAAGHQGEVSKDSAKGAEISKDFQKSLSQASEKPAGLTDKNKAELDELALKASEKDATEKAAQTALQAAALKTPQAQVPAKGGAQVEEALTDAKALKGGSPLNAKAGLGKAGLVANPQLQKLQGEQVKDAKNQAQNQVQNETHAADLEADAQLQKLVDASSTKSGGLSQTQMTALMSGETATSGIANVKGGKTANALHGEHAFEIESLDVKDGNSFSDQAAEMKSRVPSSKLSTSDYLNLRDLSQQSAKQVVTRDAISAQNPTLQASNLNSLTSAGIGMKAASLAGGKEKSKTGAANEAAPGSVIAFDRDRASTFSSKTIDAPVTQGSNQKMVLTHDTVSQISNHVNLMNQAKQDGEIKIRLRPDHLGELSMSVRTQGNAVSIQIKAQDGEAKKIIEESLGSLRDSLSQQNLTLGRVDVVTQSPQAQNDQGMQMDMSQQQFRQNHDQSGFNHQEQNARQDRFFEDQAKPVNLNAGRMVSQMSAVRSRAGSANGLDMIA